MAYTYQTAIDLTDQVSDDASEHADDAAEKLVGPELLTKIVLEGGGTAWPVPKVGEPGDEEAPEAGTEEQSEGITVAPYGLILSEPIIDPTAPTAGTATVATTAMVPCGTPVEAATGTITAGVVTLESPAPAPAPAPTPTETAEPVLVEYEAGPAATLATPATYTYVPITASSSATAGSATTAPPEDAEADAPADASDDEGEGGAEAGNAEASAASSTSASAGVASAATATAVDPIKAGPITAVDAVVSTVTCCSGS